MANMGKVQNPKFKVRFLLNAYGFVTIVELKDLKSNHPQSGTGCAQYLHRTEGRHLVKVFLLENPNTGKKETLILTEMPKV